MTIAAIGAGTAPPAYLPDNTQAAPAPESAAAETLRVEAAATLPASAPYLNPAIADIAAHAAATSPLVSPADFVLYGDSGLLIQAYGAVALLGGPLPLVPNYGLPLTPEVSPVAETAPYPPVQRIDYSA